jgi:hypothetical protein
MVRMMAALLLTALTAACNIGPRGEGTALAQSPRGALVELTTTAGELQGELLEMRSTGVVMLSDAGQITLVQYEAVRGGRVENGPRNLNGRQMADGRVNQLMRRMSRFPQGLSAELEAELLRAHGQQSLTLVTP